jgi:hypothetical protein
MDLLGGKGDRHPPGIGKGSWHAPGIGKRGWHPPGIGKGGGGETLLALAKEGVQISLFNNKNKMETNW